jgi:hypothetical protein
VPEKDGKTQECYEVRLVKIAGGKETVIESKEVPMEKLQQQTSELPLRVSMSLVNANGALPINLALAANVLSDDSVAMASARQFAPIEQST